MCGCGCELGLVLAVCRAAEERDAEAQKARAVHAQRSRSMFERITMILLAGMLGDTPMQRLTRGSGW